jgi:ketosteroid isomerase-like protein
MPGPELRDTALAMSQENVEIVRKAFEAVAVGDRERALSYADPAMVVDATRRVFNPATYRGTEGLRQMLADMDEVWKSLRPEPREFLDMGDRVVVVGRMVAKGKGSGVEVEREFAGVWTVRNGRIVRWDLFSDRAEALEAAGVPEQDAYADA